MTTPRWPRYGAALLGFVWFLHIGGGPTLNPMNIGWILAGDWRQHWLGWLFFRHQPWTFPLGRTASLLYPIGTTIGFTDSNPLVSLLLKPFSGLLPAEFQFIGPWLALCFVMQGYMGAALASTVTRDSGQQLLGGYLFVMSPVLAARLGHDTLCAHWLLLALLYFGLRAYADARDARRGARLAMGTAMLSAAIHPYLAAMCWVLAHAGYLRMWRSKMMTRARVAIVALATTAGMLGVFGAIGYFGDAGMGSSGFGVFSADLTTLINPGHVSRLLPVQTLPPGQWEGMGFVGLGGLLAGAIAVIAFARRRPSLRAGTWPVIAACVLLAIYALSSHVTFAGREVLTMRGFYRPLEPLTSSFRASGRFIWSLHYLALLFGIWGVTRIVGSSRQSVATAFLAVAVVLQGTDHVMEDWSSVKTFRQANVSDFAPAAGHYRHVAVFPMQVLGACGNPYEEDHVYRFMLEAYRLGMTYNSGIFARLPIDKVRVECARLDRAVEAGQLDPQTIYLVARPHVPQFKLANAACGRSDGDWICVSRDSDEVFRTLVETGKLIERK